MIKCQLHNLSSANILKLEIRFSEANYFNIIPIFFFFSRNKNIFINTTKASSRFPWFFFGKLGEIFHALGGFALKNSDSASEEYFYHQIFFSENNSTVPGATLNENWERFWIWCDLSQIPILFYKGHYNKVFSTYSIT